MISNAELFSVVHEAIGNRCGGYIKAVFRELEDFQACVIGRAFKVVNKMARLECQQVDLEQLDLPQGGVAESLTAEGTETLNRMLTSDDCEALYIMAATAWQNAK